MLGKAKSSLVSHELGAVFCALRVDPLHGNLQLFCILVHLSLNSFSKLTVCFVPGLGVLRDVVFLPLWDVSLDEAEPQLVVVLHDVR